MQALDHEKLQKIQDGIAELAGIYLYCVDADGNAVTKLSGEPKEGERLSPADRERKYRSFV